MFKIDKDTKEISITRGTTGTIGLKLKDKITKEPMILKVDDIVRIKIFERKGCNRVLFEKDVKIKEETDMLKIQLLSSETKIGELINKPKKYWYEIELNPDTEFTQSLVSYDEDGEKIFMLYPEGGDK